MSQVHRPRHSGKVAIDVRLLQEIEGAAMIDCEPPPGVIAPLAARFQAERDAYRSPYLDDDLTAEVEKALHPYGAFLDLEEIHAVQQLRGWHRARYGRITVDAGHLSAVRNLLDDLTLSLGDSCEDEQRDCDPEWEPEIAAQIAESMARTGRCGECAWCTALWLRDECDAVLDAAGHEGGVYYRAYVLGQSVDEANSAVYGSDWRRTFGLAPVIPEGEKR